MRITFSSSASKNRDIGIVSLTEGKETLVSVLPNGSKKISIGYGEKKSITRRKLILLARQAVFLAKQHKVKKFSIVFSDFVFPHMKIAQHDLAELLATNFEMANFEFVKYKTPPKEGFNFVEEIVVVGKLGREAQKGFAAGQMIGREVNACRTLANTPGSEMTPKILGEEAKKAARGTRVRVRILGFADIRKLKMGGILGVSQGSSEAPRFIILEYWGAKSRKEKPVVLVGKGITFDSGGLSLKPGDAMLDMHMDMSGGAAVIHAVVLAAKLKLAKNIIGLVPAVENMPSGSSYRPGDVLRTMSGKTVEVLNTDAEGRIVLADGLTYAKRYDPTLVIDVATLTGAAMSALGQRASALFTTNEKLEKLFREAGEESGDFVWPLPLWEEYEEEIKATFGDVANVGKTRYGGAITAAAFLWQFTKHPLTRAQLYPWVHVDIAPRMTAIEGEHLAKGAAGAPVRLLAYVLKKIT